MNIYEVLNHYLRQIYKRVNKNHDKFTLIYQNYFVKLFMNADIISKASKKLN